MGFLSDAWKGITNLGGLAAPFLTGTAFGLPAAPIAAIGSSLFGGGSQAPAGRAQPLAAAGGAQPISRLDQYLQQQAYLRGIRETFGLAPAGTYSASAALAGQAPAARGGGSVQGFGQQQQQAGGLSFPQNIGAPRPSLLGRGGGQGRGAAGNDVQDDDLLSIEDLFRAQQRQALAGYGGLPQNVYQGAVTRGMGVIGAQAQRSREQLASGLGSRGLLRSGIYGQGLADIERGRLGAVGQLTGGLEEQGLAAARSAQQYAGGLFSAEQQDALNRALQLQLQGRQISAAQPSTWDKLAQAIQLGVQYKNRPQPIDLSGLFGGRNVAPGPGASTYGTQRDLWYNQMYPGSPGTITI